MATPLALSQAVGGESSNSLVSPKALGKESFDYLPQVDANQLVVWNNSRRQCCGHLMKKGGSSGGGGALFGNRKNWQKRFFVLEHRIEKNENYVLKYYVKPDDAKPKGVLPLDGCEVLVGASRSKKGEKEFAFQLKVGLKIK